MINKVILLGYLGADPEIRVTQQGKNIATLSLATREVWKDKTTHERHEKTEWHRVVIFNEALANVAQSYLRKGSKLYLEGSLQTRKWTDNQGQDRWTTEVVLQGLSGTLKLLDAPQMSENTRPLDDDIPF